MIALHKPRTVLEADLVTELSTASRKMRTLFDSFLRQRGLTLARARALIHLSRNPGLNQTELANILEIECPTVGRLLDGMEKQGLIERQAIDGDRRGPQIAVPPPAPRPGQEIAGDSRALGRPPPPG